MLCCFVLSLLLLLQIGLSTDLRLRVLTDLMDQVRTQETKPQP
jgi:hypothetical protein